MAPSQWQDDRDTKADPFLEDLELLWQQILALGLPNGFAKPFLDGLAVCNTCTSPLFPLFLIQGQTCIEVSWLSFSHFLTKVFPLTKSLYA